MTLMAGILIPAAALGFATQATPSKDTYFSPLNFLHYTYILFIMVGRKFLALVNSFEWETIKRHLKRAPLGLGALGKRCLDTSGKFTHIWSKTSPKLLLTFCSHIPLWQFYFRSKCPPPLASALCPNLALSWLPTSPVRLPQVMVSVYWMVHQPGVESQPCF